MTNRVDDLAPPAPRRRRSATLGVIALLVSVAAGALPVSISAARVSPLESTVLPSPQTAFPGPWTLPELLSLFDRPSETLGDGWSQAGSSSVDAGPSTNARTASLTGPAGQRLDITVFETVGNEPRMGELLAATSRAFDRSSGQALGERPLPAEIADLLPACVGGRFADGAVAGAATMEYEAHVLCYPDRTGALLLAYRSTVPDAESGADTLTALLGRSGAASAPAPLAAAWLLPPGTAPSGRSLGNPDAPVTLEIWGDYQSVGSRNFARLALPRLIEEFVEPGLVRIEARDNPFIGSESVLGAMAAECAARQQRFWDLHLLLYPNQGTFPDSGAFAQSRLTLMAEAAGLDIREFDACLDGDEARSSVEAALAEASAAGLESLPSLVVDGERIDWTGLEALGATLRDLVAAEAPA